MKEPTDRRADLTSAGRAAWTWGLTAFALYALTAARGPMWADSSKLALYAMHSYVPSLNPGDHPGWTVLARVWLLATGWMNPILSLHLFAAFCGAVTVGLASLYVARRTTDPERVRGMASALAVCLPLWWSSTLTETYSLSFALILGVAVCATNTCRGWACSMLAGLLTGLALSVHAFTLVLTFPLLTALPRRRWMYAGAGLLIGSAPLWLGLLGTPVDPLTGHQAGGASSWSWVVAWFLQPRHALKGLIFLVGIGLYGVGPFVLFGFLTAIRNRVTASHPRPRLALALLAGLGLVLTSYAPYRLHLMVGFLTIGLLLILQPALSRRLSGLHVAVQVLLYLSIPFALQMVGRGGLGVRRLPERTNAWYFLCPVRTFDQGPERYASSLLESAPAHAVIVSDFNPGTVLRLVQETRRMRGDLLLLPTAIDEAQASLDPTAAIQDVIRLQLADNRPVVLADSYEPYYHVKVLQKRFGIVTRPCGPGVEVLTDGSSTSGDNAPSREPPSQR